MSTNEYENDTGNKQIKPDKECTDDVCQLQTHSKRHMSTYCIECTKSTSLRSATANSLSLFINGESLKPTNFISKVPKPNSIFTLIKMPLEKSDISTRVRRDRPNHQRACTHQIVCHEGDRVLEKMKVIPIYIRTPVVGINRHDKYKELRLRKGKYYKVSKSSTTDISFTCLSDSIPQSSVGWIREISGSREIISRNQYLDLPNAQPDTSGKYYCYGANQMGMKIVELRLRIH